MTILISGGLGFVGSHLTERLLQERNDICVVDNLVSSPLMPEAYKVLWGERWTLLDYREMSLQSYEIAFDDRALGAIYHLASPVGPAGVLPLRGYIIREIVDATYSAIELALRHKCRLVYVSSSEVYGGGVEGLCREDMSCVVPIANPSARLEYAIGKLAGEIAVLNTPGLDTVIVRPFNVAGPRQSSKGGFVLPRFVQQALAGEPLTVFGDGSQVRAFTHVADIVDGLILAMQEGKAGEAYNLGNPENKTTILNLAHLVGEAMDWPMSSLPATIHFLDGREVYGPDYREANDKWPDATKAITELGWTPKYSIEQTIQDVITYERSRVHVD